MTVVSRLLTGVSALRFVVGATRTGAAAEAPANVAEIVVTAQKREQSLQDVPIVVTTVSHQLLQDSGVKDIKDLAQLTPGLLVTSTTSAASTIRNSSPWAVIR